MNFISFKKTYLSHSDKSVERPAAASDSHAALRAAAKSLPNASRQSPQILYKAVGNNYEEPIFDKYYYSKLNKFDWAK